MEKATEPRASVVRLILFALLALLAGCVTRSASELRTRDAFERGRASSAQPAPVSVAVTVIGPVRHRSILWSEGLTLARAIIGAEYLLENDPSAIFLTRGSQTMQFTSAQLLGGNEGPVLMPGDLVEIRP
jgi:hypothetical protein